MKKVYQLVLGLVCIATLWGCQSNTQQSMPTFKVSEVNGKTLTQDTLKGKVTVINFWATSCTSCVKEMHTCSSY